MSLAGCSPPPATLPPLTGTSTPIFLPTPTPSPVPSLTETPQIMPTPLSPAEQQAIDAQLIQAAESGDPRAVLALLAAGQISTRRMKEAAPRSWLPRTRT